MYPTARQNLNLWTSISLAFLTCLGLSRGIATAKDPDQSLIQSTIQERCIYCHEGSEASGGVVLAPLLSTDSVPDRAELLVRVIKVVDSHSMPPAGEEDIESGTRIELVDSLRHALRVETSGYPGTRDRLQRLNRFQYNNTVRDLFELDRDVFALPEKLMTRYSDYLRHLDGAEDGSMPGQVEVACHSLEPIAGMREVRAFPKDLRAEHGFDNQANQLTLSPLLLDAFLRLSVSIVSSPDFNPKTVGIWDQFFAAPASDAVLDVEIRTRVSWFLLRAFRGPVTDEVRRRYVVYVRGQLDQGIEFPEAMKKMASAVLSSPLFLFRHSETESESGAYGLASKLSYFLWASCPDDELLQAAESGELASAEAVRMIVARMLRDPKIERFLDSFPGQWMQLQNVLAVTPDPKISRYFALDAKRPASVQMVLEPLLLFDAVFVENRPLGDLLSPGFGYQSDFLRTWYTGSLQPPKIDLEAIRKQNDKQDRERQRIGERLAKNRTALRSITRPVVERILKERNGSNTKETAVDLNPYAVWDFNNSFAEPIHGLQLKPNGDVKFEDTGVTLNQGWLISEPLPIELRAKTLEVRFRLKDLDQRGGGVMGIQGPRGLFDSIVIGERKPRHWISGSNGFARTEDFPGSEPEQDIDLPIHLTMVYHDDDQTLLYRNGEPYGKPFRKGRATFPRRESTVLFGLRHLPPGGNRFLRVHLEHARLYDRALTPDEVKLAASGAGAWVSERELIAALSDGELEQREQLRRSIATDQESLAKVPANRNVDQVRKEVRQRFENELRRMRDSKTFRRRASDDVRYGGIVTNAAVMSMTSGPQRTHPVARGVWMIEVILNDPPSPPPNDVPPLDEEAGDHNLTIREKFAAHRDNEACAGCHSRLDPLGFALENYDVTGRWRSKYPNGRDVDVTGTLLRTHEFASVAAFKDAIQNEQVRFARAFLQHLMRYAVGRELTPSDEVVVDDLLQQAKADQYRIQGLIQAVASSESFWTSRSTDNKD